MLEANQREAEQRHKAEKLQDELSILREEGKQGREVNHIEKATGAKVLVYRRSNE